mgnify:CR=1 FL=1
MPLSSSRYYGVNTGNNDFALLANNPENGKMSLLLNGNIYANGIYSLNNNDYNSKVGFDNKDNIMTIKSKMTTDYTINIKNNLYGSFSLLAKKRNDISFRF